MKMAQVLKATSVILFIASWMVDGGAAKSGTSSVLDFGAVGDGQTDDSNAFAEAWKAVCGDSGETPTLEIPQGKTFLIQSCDFSGPCASSTGIHILMSGSIIAPGASTWANCGKPLIRFSHVDGLIIDGSGQIDGQGATWWNQAGTGSCSRRPDLIEFDSCNNLQLSGINTLNSPQMHFFINSCDSVTISSIRITAPANSPNTDGIDISHSSQVAISDSFIGTGDDCVAINGGCKGINITRVTCGPGHGISIGSLGDDGPNDSVEEVLVQGCTFNGTQHGARIKTEQGQGGYAKSVHFSDITLIATNNPIIIDQYYCNGKEHGCPNQESTIVVSDITYIGFEGTSASIDAISLDCSNHGCRGLVLDKINMTSSVSSQQLQSSCKNAYGTATSTNPTVSCLQPS